MLRFMISGTLSTIVMIHLHGDREEWHSFSLCHALFHLLVLIEKLTLVNLPYLLDAKYLPPLDCVTADSQFTAVCMVLTMWTVGVVTIEIRLLL
jgi:hypothetical protein